MKNTTFYKVSTWKNGNAENTKSTFGIRIKKADFSSLENWKEIKVGGKRITKTSKTKFTEKCPEIRNIKIKEFLIDNKLANWKPYKPNELKLYEIEKDIFELRIK